MQPLFFRLVVLSVCLGIHGLFGQQANTYTKADGILSFPVTATYVDSRGIVWIGNDEGLNAFSGNTWYSITEIENRVTGNRQPLDRILRIFEDRQRNVWFSTDYGLFLFDGSYWVNYLVNKDENNYHVDRIFQDRQNRIWVTQEFRKDFMEVPSFSYTLLSGSVMMFDGRRWYKFDEDVAESAAIRSDISFTYFTDMLQDRAGDLWFASLRGLHRFDGEAWTSFRRETLSVLKVLDLHEDLSGNLWAATEAGVAKYHNGQWVTYDAKDGLNGDIAYRIVEDKMGRIWAFTRTDMKYTGLYQYANGGWTHYSMHDIRLKGELEQVFCDGNSFIVFAEDGLARFDEAGWHRFNKKDGLEGRNFSVIFRDRNKQLWTASEHDLYNFTEGVWTKVFHYPEKWKVTAIFVDASGILWVGTEKSGLLQIEGEKWNRYSGQQVLEDDHVYSIFEDKQHNVWIVTKRGLTMFQPELPQ